MSFQEAPLVEYAGSPVPWVHLFDAHEPYCNSFGWTGDPYQELFAMDRGITTTVTVPENTGTLVVADHGEKFMGRWELDTVFF